MRSGLNLLNLGLMAVLLVAAMAVHARGDDVNANQPIADQLRQTSFIQSSNLATGPL